MKRILFLSFLFAISLITFAQTQQGRVKTRGRLNSNGKVTPGKGISGATVTLGNGSALVSGNNGTFSFAVSKGTYSLKNVQKQNYQICDRDLLGRNKKYSTDVLEIAMQTPDEALEYRLESEEKIRATLTVQLNKQKEELRRLKEQQRISLQEYNEKLKALYDDLNNNEKFISEMAERYSTMDFDQMDEFQRRVAFYIRNGELARADSLLNTKGSMEERSDEIDKARKANVEEKADLAHRQENLDKSEKRVEILVEDFGADCYSRYEMCKLQHKNDSAVYWLELRASKDSLNIEWQLEAGVFISDYLSGYEKALKYYQTALTNALNRYGNEHPAVATSYDNIGDIYLRQGNYARALEFFTMAFEIRRMIFDSDHPDVAQSYYSIGSFYDSQGDYARSLEYHTKALEIRKKVFGDEHPAVAQSYSTIGIVYSIQGDYSRASEYCIKALDIQKKVFGEAHPDVGVNYAAIGHIYSSQGDYIRALECHTKSLDIFKKAFGEVHPAVAQSYSIIGVLYSTMGDYARALEYHTKSVDILKEIFGEEHPDVAKSYNEIGYIYYSQGDYACALECYLMVLKIQKKVFGGDHPDVALSYNTIGTIYSLQGDYARALEYNTRALDIRKRVFGEDHPDVALSYNTIGTIYYSQCDYTHALEYYTKALEIQKKVFGDEHPEVANTFKRVHEIYDKFKSNKVNVQELKETISIMAYTLTCIEGDTPAKQQGMSGEYIVLRFEDWLIMDGTSLLNKNDELRGKPKTIVVMKDGVISEHFFESTIGVQISCKYVGREEKQRIIEAYEQWEKIRSAGK